MESPSNRNGMNKEKRGNRLRNIKIVQKEQTNDKIDTEQKAVDHNQNQTHVHGQTKDKDTKLWY